MDMYPNPNQESDYTTVLVCSYEHFNLASYGLGFYGTFLSGELRYPYLPHVLRAWERPKHPLVGLLTKYRKLVNPEFGYRPEADAELRHLQHRLRSLSRQLTNQFYAHWQGHCGRPMQLRFTDPELRLLAEGVEFYSRFLGGQIGGLDLPDAVRSRVWPRTGEIDALAEQLRPLLFPTLAPHYRSGIGWDLEDPRQQALQRGYEFYKAILAYDNERRGVHNVHSGPVLHYSDWPLPRLQPYGKFPLTAAQVDAIHPAR